jgi:3-deoxy-D-manno-octulosonate 8-phosphate phosphatase KdsC-like HAD superfamily phosphatase
MPNDLPLLNWVGVSCAVTDAYRDVLAVASRVIGGSGARR